MRNRTCSKAPGSNSTCEGTSTEARLCKIEDCNLGKLLKLSRKQQSTLSSAPINITFSFKGKFTYTGARREAFTEARLCKIEDCNLGKLLSRK